MEKQYICQNCGYSGKPKVDPLDVDIKWLLLFPSAWWMSEHTRKLCPKCNKHEMKCINCKAPSMSIKNIIILIILFVIIFGIAFYFFN
jgi:hypothetical protein